MSYVEKSSYSQTAHKFGEYIFPDPSPVCCPQKGEQKASENLLWNGLFTFSDEGRCSPGWLAATAEPT